MTTLAHTLAIATMPREVPEGGALLPGSAYLAELARRRERIDTALEDLAERTDLLVRWRRELERSYKERKRRKPKRRRR